MELGGSWPSLHAALAASPWIVAVILGLRDAGPLACWREGVRLPLSPRSARTRAVNPYRGYRSIDRARGGPEDEPLFLDDQHRGCAVFQVGTGQMETRVSTRPGSVGQDDQGSGVDSIPVA